jgi:hypothetical protein
MLSFHLCLNILVRTLLANTLNWAHVSFINIEEGSVPLKKLRKYTQHLRLLFSKLFLFSYYKLIF